MQANYPDNMRAVKMSSSLTDAPYPFHVSIKIKMLIHSSPRSHHHNTPPSYSLSLPTAAGMPPLPSALTGDSSSSSSLTPTSFSPRLRLVPAPALLAGVAAGVFFCFLLGVLTGETASTSFPFALTAVKLLAPPLSLLAGAAGGTYSSRRLRRRDQRFWAAALLISHFLATASQSILSCSERVSHVLVK